MDGDAAVAEDQPILRGIAAHNLEIELLVDYGVSPRRFDVEGFRRSRREAMHSLARLPAGTNPDGFAVTFRNCPARRVAYIRVHRPYEGDHVPQAVARLLAWADARVPL